MSEHAPIVVDPDVYDTLELSALAFGGIGRVYYCENGHQFGHEPDAVPRCIVGHGRVAGIPSVNHGLPGTLFSSEDNDTAVARINQRLGKRSSSRVSWRAYCAERNIIRGDAADATDQGVTHD